jgi:predicted nucleic acid-binding Zn ribbon protein
MSTDTITLHVCACCGAAFRPQRSWQRFCSATCQDRAKKQRQRAGNAGTSPDQVTQPIECGDTASAPLPRPPVAPPQTPSYGWGDTPLKPSPLDGKPVLLGDDYPLDYYDDGYPKLPDCLRRNGQST